MLETCHILCMHTHTETRKLYLIKSLYDSRWLKWLCKQPTLCPLILNRGNLRVDRTRGSTLQWGFNKDTSLMISNLSPHCRGSRSPQCDFSITLCLPGNTPPASPVILTLSMLSLPGGLMYLCEDNYSQLIVSFKCYFFNIWLKELF